MKAQENHKGELEMSSSGNFLCKNELDKIVLDLEKVSNLLKLNEIQAQSIAALQVGNP